MQHSNISGTIPDELAELTNAQQLLLNNNNLTKS